MLPALQKEEIVPLQYILSFEEQEPTFWHHSLIVQIAMVAIICAVIPSSSVPEAKLNGKQF